MEGAPGVRRPTRGTALYVLAGFLLVAAVATWQFGANGLFLILIVAGITLIVTGFRSRTGWPRAVLIAAGVLVMLAPLFITLLDVAFGTWVVTVR